MFFLNFLLLSLSNNLINCYCCPATKGSHFAFVWLLDSKTNTFITGTAFPSQFLFSKSSKTNCRDLFARSVDSTILPQATLLTVSSQRRSLKLIQFKPLVRGYLPSGGCKLFLRPFSQAKNIVYFMVFLHLRPMVPSRRALDALCQLCRQHIHGTDTTECVYWFPHWIARS